ncbi:MAG: YbbR-like domain-containing protein [Bacteroidales bacterium]|nr:YbbR-like domain-containing protein [Bacteroidales bacterium]
MNSEKTRTISTGINLLGNIKLLSGKWSPYNQKLIIFLFFVIISAGFWYIRSLGEEYEAVVDYPVKYSNFPEGKVLIGAVPGKLTLRVKSNGFNILKSKLNLNIIPLKFDVNSYSLNSLGVDTFFILTETVTNILSEELNQMQILDIEPDTLFFRFSELRVKKIPVRPILNIHEKFFHVQYMQNGDIDVIPDSIIISGPSTLLNSMTYAHTEPVHLSNLSDTAEISCNLQSVDGINFSQQKVKLIIPVDKFTEVEETLSVVSINEPDSLQMIAIPGQVKITYRICISNYNKISANPLLLFIDYNDIGGKQQQRLPVMLSDTPQYISSIRLNPEMIEFLIRRK